MSVDLGQVTIFVGQNGSGKSNIIDAIRLMRDAAQFGLDRAISDRHGIESVRQWSPTRPYRISFEVDTSEQDRRCHYEFSLDSRAGQFSILKEYASVEEVSSIPSMDDEPVVKELRIYTRTTSRRGKGGVQVTEWVVPIGDLDYTWLELSSLISGTTESKQWVQPTEADELAIHRPSLGLYNIRTALARFQAYSIYPNTLRVPQEPSNDTFLASEGRNIASVFKRMRKTKRGSEAIAQITEAMKTILPNLERISILNVGGFLVPQFHMLEPNQRRHVFNVSQMSDGTLRVLGLLTAIYQEPKPSVIALEEPEQTVNPGILAVIAESIKEVSKRTQILVTTHSPDFLDQFDPEHVISVELVNGNTRVGRVSEVQMKAARDNLFSLGELLSLEGISSE